MDGFNEALSVFVTIFCCVRMSPTQVISQKKNSCPAQIVTFHRLYCEKPHQEAKRHAHGRNRTAVVSELNVPQTEMLTTIPHELMWQPVGVVLLLDENCVIILVYTYAEWKAPSNPLTLSPRSSKRVEMGSTGNGKRKTTSGDLACQHWTEAL
ncbi:hypothetical protein EDB81DRAFT_15467 [Dactylonectria macrodidyma]|uniref:Uncharacterized protein n=1 Tax=Dactylonectria macrodidyma TaxID=307937 RepID=A0A9P9FUM1_9HYPO|nr:hypothetical protein EDB81DRAFT_15467 [Dactylonectria macrodidyma]